MGAQSRRPTLPLCAQDVGSNLWILPRRCLLVDGLNGACSLRCLDDLVLFLLLGCGEGPGEDRVSSAGLEQLSICATRR